MLNFLNKCLQTCLQTRLQTRMPELILVNCHAWLHLGFLAKIRICIISLFLQSADSSASQTMVWEGRGSDQGVTMKGTCEGDPGENNSQCLLCSHGSTLYHLW